MLNLRAAAGAFILSHDRLALAILGGALICVPTTTRSAPFQEPAVLASSGGVLDLLMIAKPLPIPSISFPPPNGGSPINPIGWVYEICPRPADANICPAGGSTVADYGGVRLALQPGDSLRIRLVNRLPSIDPLKVKHSHEPGKANIPLNPTNLHTHGLIVPARAPTLSDPTFGDFVFVEIYNPANGTPAPQLTHQHGSIKMDFADYRIDVPANHPSGLFWFHPHVHGLTLNQVSSGLSGMITIGNVADYINNPPSLVRHLMLKDLQVLDAGTLEFDLGTVTVVDGEVQHQQSGFMCEDHGGKEPPGSRQGFCDGVPPELGFVNNYTGSKWYFPVSGQLFPTIAVTSPDGEIWRFTNASGQVTYRLKLQHNNATKDPMLMQLISIDGVSIDVPPGTAAGTIMKMGGNRFTVADCPSGGASLLPVCIVDLIMMPSSRAEVWIAYRDSSGNVVTPPPGAAATLTQNLLFIGPAGERWPEVKLANIEFAQPTAARSAVNVGGGARAALSPTGIFGTVPRATSVATPIAARPAAACRPLPDGHRRRIFFGFVDPTDPNTAFGLGYEEVDQNGGVVPGTQRPVSAFDPSRIEVCLPLGPGGATVHETWELISLATEIHNFHIHQTRFRILDAKGLEVPQSSPDTAVIIEDNVPVPFAIANSSEIADNQNGYCTIEQWRSGVCTSHTIVVDIPFSQLGEFVYHCHIIEHGDGGMMAKIVVVPGPSLLPTPHDFDGDNKSDILWRHNTGVIAAWLMNGAQVTQSGALGTVPNRWSVVGQRDFNNDGMSDLLWRDISGNVAIWMLNGLQVLQSASLGTVSLGWAVAGTEDFNGDGNGDILWRDATGNVAIWFMQGAQILQSAALGTVPLTWRIVGVGDFNGDGKADILWRDWSGSLAVWFVEGPTNVQTASLGGVPPNWIVAGTGDFNGDGKTDILWRDLAGGAVAIWFLDGVKIVGSANLGRVGLEWSIIETGDFNRDAKSDILWRRNDGSVAVWLLNGAQIFETANVAAVGTDWQIQNLNAD